MKIVFKNIYNKFEKIGFIEVKKDKYGDKYERLFRYFSASRYL